MRLKICLAALAATVAFASPAFAQVATATAEARGLVLQPLTLTKVDDLDFGTVVSSNVAGNVTIDADTAAARSTGGVTPFRPSPATARLFAGAGTAGQEVIMLAVAPAVLVSTTNPLDTITVTSMVLDQRQLYNRTIGGGGTFPGRRRRHFAIAANQPNGLYKADFDLTAEYQ
jgi:hypothetical protein